MQPSSLHPPSQFVSILTHLKQTCIAVLYCVITFILFIDNILPFLLNSAMDAMLLIALIVIAVVVGKPLSYQNCQIIGTASVAESAYQFSAELKKEYERPGGKMTYSNWIGATKSTCLEMKAIWGLSIALWYALTPLLLFFHSGSISIVCTKYARKKLIYVQL